MYGGIRAREMLIKSPYKQHQIHLPQACYLDENLV